MSDGDAGARPTGPSDPGGTSDGGATRSAGGTSNHSAGGTSKRSAGGAAGRIAAVAFDVDGTLYPNAAMRRRVFSRVLRNLRFFHAYGQVRRGLRDGAVRATASTAVGDVSGAVGYAPTGGTITPAGSGAGSDFYHLQASRLAARLGITTEAARGRIQELVYDGLLLSLERLAPVPYLVDLLRSLDAAGLPLGLLSDFPIERKPELLGLPSVWRCRICSEEVGALKPHPAPFQALADCLGVAAHEVLFVGNSFESDVVGAKNAGMTAAYFAPGWAGRVRVRRGDIADLSFSDYRDLWRWIFSV